MKKIFVMGCFFLCVLQLFGCGNVNKEQAEVVDTNLPGWQRDKSDKVDLDWYVNYSWFTTSFGGNVVSDKIEEETGVHINFISPKGNEIEKFNALISSGALPDIITMGWWEDQVDEMINKELVYSLNELADTHDVYFWQVTEPKVCSWYTREDGNLYAYPNSTYLPEDYEKYDNIGSNQTFMVRKDIYEAIGSPDMTTPEGFMQAVKDASEMFPLIEGEPIIPIGAHVFTNIGCNSFDQYLQNFLAIPFEQEGQCYDRDTDPEYIRWLKMFRELGTEGYLKEDIFIDQRVQMEEKQRNGRYFCMLYQRTDMEAQQKALYVNNPGSIYIAVDGPQNSQGDNPVLPGAGINGWTVTLISKNCERPDRAIELMSYLLSEHGQKLTSLGVEGITYDMVEGKPVLKEEVKQLLCADRAAYDKLYGGDNAYWMLQDNVMQLEWKEPPEPPMGQMEEWTYPYTQYLGHYETSFDANTEAGNAYAKIQKLWSEVLPKLLLAPTEQEFDRLLDEFVAKRQEMGFQTVMKERTRQMLEIKKKLGIN